MDAGFQAYVTCEPWDLLDEGVEQVLDRLIGEAGIDGIRVSVVTGPVHLFRAHAGASPRTVRFAAAAHFQPEARCYADSRLRPVAAAWIKTRNPLETISRACESRRLKLRAHVVACEAPSLIERHPVAACKDAYGDPSAARICPTNPDVRAYLGGLIEDLCRNYAIEAVDVAEADFGRPQDFHPGRRDPVDWAGWERGVLCLCESCRQAAGAAGIQGETLAASMQSSADDSREILQAYNEFRGSAVMQCVDAMRRRATREVWLDVDDLHPHRGLHAEQVLSRVSGAFVRWGDQAVQLAGPRDRIGMRRCVGIDTHIGDGSTLVREASDFARQGGRRLVFESYGMTPFERFDWLRQAIRFARRETER